MMEVSLLEALLNNIDSFLHLSSCGNLDSEPLRKYYEKIEKILKLLKPVLESITDTDAASHDLLKRLFLQLVKSVDEMRDLSENWHPLAGRVSLVLQAEPLIAKIRISVLEILRFLEDDYEAIPAQMIATSVECCTRKVKETTCEQAESIISEAIRDEAADHGLNPERLVKIAGLLGLRSNQDIFIEAVALEKLKENSEQAERDAEVEYFEQLIALIMQLHDHLIMIKQSQSSTPVPIPPDFCCPLSLNLMTDPVIVSTGQTYERAYISKWLELGVNICPKTRQALGHTNLVPNYTVKALMANWCELNNVKLPDSSKSVSLNQPLIDIFPTVWDTSKEISAVCHPSDQDSLEEDISVAVGFDEQLGHSRAAPGSRVIPDSIRSSEQLISETCTAVPASSSQPDDEFPERPIVARSRNRTMWHRRPETCAPKIVSSLGVGSRPDHSAVEDQVKSLVENLSSTSIERQREATGELRLLAKHNMNNRVIISESGAIDLLVKLLLSTDPMTQENAVTALLNLSLSDNNKTAIANAGSIKPLIHVLRSGSPEARGNSAATLFSLSVVDVNKLTIGRAGAIGPLVELLGNGTLSGKKDAATALFNLSISHENKPKIVEAGAVKHLIELVDPAAGMVDKAVAALANLAAIPEGKNAIGQLGGIPVLVEVVELGSARGKENATAALLQLCTVSSRFCNMALQEGVVPPLVALSQTGTARGKEKAQALLSYLRNQRRGNPGRR